MTVTFDAVANLGTATITAGLSQSFTLGGSATGLLVAVGGAHVTWAALTTKTVTVGGQPMSLLGFVNSNNVAADGWTALWIKVGPPTGPQTIAVVANNGATPAFINVTAISFNGLGQFGPAVVNYGTAAATSSGAIVSATGNRVLTVTGANNGTLTLTGGGTQRSKMPASPTTNVVTLLVQDTAGAATVTNTATFSGSLGWGDISVNLIAGNLYNVGASLSLTTARSAAASFVGQVWHIGAHLSLTTAAATTGSGQPQGPPLRYVGRPPDSPSVLGTTTYAQAEDASNLVTPTWINQQVTQAAKNLVTPAWVTEQAAGYLTQSAATAALAAYVPTSELGATSGIAQAASDGFVPSGQLPALNTNNVAKVYDCAVNGTVFLPTGTTHTVITEVIGEFVLANVVIPNPGYPWVALPFAYVLGYSSGTAGATRLVGNDNVGFLAVTQPEQETPIYGMSLMTADTLPNYYTVLPGSNGLATITPANQPPFETGVTLQLSVCNFSGSTYTVSGTGLIFYVLVLPALGG